SLALFVGKGARWRERDGALVTKSRGPGPKFRLSVVPGTGTFTLEVWKAELPAPVANPVRVSLVMGPVAAELEADWVEDPERPGSFTYE
ncbi:MAG: hypothetical protein ACYTDY_19475, partial [Planctomycetota bacterium]